MQFQSRWAHQRPLNATGMCSFPKWDWNTPPPNRPLTLACSLPMPHLNRFALFKCNCERIRGFAGCNPRNPVLISFFQMSSLGDVLGYMPPEHSWPENQTDKTGNATTVPAYPRLDDVDVARWDCFEHDVGNHIEQLERDAAQTSLPSTNFCGMKNFAKCSFFSESDVQDGVRTHVGRALSELTAVNSFLVFFRRYCSINFDLLQGASSPTRMVYGDKCTNHNGVFSKVFSRFL